jgi:hypothetical protein
MGIIGMSLTCTVGRVFADSWSVQPLVGVAAVYSSNPQLLTEGYHPETRAAVLLDLPTYYDLETWHFSLLPRLRYSDETGYSSLASDYYHVDAGARLSTELDTLSFDASFYRDSSLLFAGETVNGIGVRKDTSLGDITWQHTFTERSAFQADVSALRVLYDTNQSQTGLVDYRYGSVSPTYSYAINERDTFKVLGSFGRYYALDGFTSSDNGNLQLGIDHRLSELWLLSANAGYSKSIDQFDFLFGETLKTNQNGAVYSLNLSRRGENANLSAGVSRSLVPSGFAFLSSQDKVSGLVNYAYSERWTFNGSAAWERLSEPSVDGGSTQRHFFDIEVSAAWRWTENWTVTLRASKIGQQYAAPAGSVTSNGLFFEIARQFYRTNN